MNYEKENNMNNFNKIFEIFHEIIEAEIASKKVWSDINQIVGGFDEDDPSAIASRIQDMTENRTLDKEDEQKIERCFADLYLAEWAIQCLWNEFHEIEVYNGSLEELYLLQVQLEYEEGQRLKRLSCNCHNPHLRDLVIVCFDMDIFVGRHGDIIIGYYTRCTDCGHESVTPTISKFVAIDIQIPKEHTVDPDEPF